MTITNDFLPFATDAQANVEDQADYLADSVLVAKGFQSGPAASAKFNKVWRQCSVIAWAIAQLISDRINASVLDDGDTATLLTQLKSAIGQTSVALTYSASITPNAELGFRHITVAGNNTAFTINAPLNPTLDRVIAITIRNTSGVALGAVTWNAIYKLGTWTQPASGFSRTITFQYNGTNWIEISRTPIDVPN